MMCLLCLWGGRKLGEEYFVQDLSSCGVGEDVAAEVLDIRAVGDCNACEQDEFGGWVA